MAEEDKKIENLEDEVIQENEEQEDQVSEDVTDDQEDEQLEDHTADDEGADDSDEEEEPPKKSRREELRIQQLLQKIKEEGTPTQPKAKHSDFDYDEELDADKETLDKLKGDRESYGQRQYQQGAEDIYRFSRFETRLEVDAPRVEAKYSTLDKESDEFNPVLADTINRMYLSFVGFDGKKRSVRTSDIRYSDYVDSIYELANEIAGEKIERTTVNLRKQAGKAGLRPGSSGQKRLNLNKAPSEMTDEELDAVIAQGIPQK